MDAMNALKQAAINSGVPLTHIGVAIGKSRQYVHATIRKGSTPTCGNMAAMLDVCGYKLAAIPSDNIPSNALIID